MYRKTFVAVDMSCRVHGRSKGFEPNSLGSMDLLIRTSAVGSMCCAANGPHRSAEYASASARCVECTASFDHGCIHARAFLLSGGIITESIFAWPGIGGGLSNPVSGVQVSGEAQGPQR